MAKLHYFLYDTALFGNAAGVEHTLFQVSQGSTAAATKVITNMRGSGSMPTTESFLAKKIHVWYNENAVAADVINLWVNSYLEFFVNDYQHLLVPLIFCASHNGFSGHYTQASAADESAIGVKGDGLTLEMPIMLPGGTTFRVNLWQGTALSTTSLSVVCALEGQLDRPN